MSCAITTVVTYTTPGAFVYDSALVEVDETLDVGRLKNLCCPDVTAYAGYDTSVDLNWGDGVLTGSAVGGAAVAGGLLDLKGGTVKYVEHTAVGNAQSTQTMCIRFMVRFDFNGNRPDFSSFVSISKPGGAWNYVSIDWNGGNGQLRTLVADRLGHNIVVSYLGAWLVKAGQWYEIEANIDITNGETRLFIGGAQFGATQTGTGIRTGTANVLRVGTDRTQTVTSDFEIRDLVIFDTVQHVANYTAPSPLPSPTPYDLTDPSIMLASHLEAGRLCGLSATVTEPGSDAVGWLMVVDDVDMWHDGAAWVASDGTLAQSNTIADADAHAADLDISEGVRLQFRPLLHSHDGSTTPSISSYTVNYCFGAEDDTNPSTCAVWGFLGTLDSQDRVSVPVVASTRGFAAGPWYIEGHSLTTYTASNGRWSLSLVQGGVYDIRTGGVLHRGVVVPASVDASLTSLL